MSTNRTKTDWAYKQAVDIVDQMADPAERPMTVRWVAAKLRLAYRRGQRTTTMGPKDRYTFRGILKTSTR